MIIRTAAALAAAATATIYFAAPPVEAATTSTTSSCQTQWGSTAKRAGATSSQKTIQNVRAGRHACFDRLVIDVTGKAGLDVRYVDRAVQDFSGKPLNVRGGAILEIRAYAPAYDADTGKPTYHPANPMEAVDVSGFSTFRQVAYATSWEGETQLFVGTRGRLPMQTFVTTGTDGSTKLVVDVAHRW